MQCSFCGRINPDGSRFCNACGAQLDLVHCPQCGAVYESGTARCSACGYGADAVASDVSTAVGAGSHGAQDRRIEVMERMHAGPGFDPRREPPAPSGAAGAVSAAARGPRLALGLLVAMAVCAAVYIIAVGYEHADTQASAPGATSPNAALPPPPMQAAQGRIRAADPHSERGAGTQRTMPARQDDPACPAGVAALGLCGPGTQHAEPSVASGLRGPPGSP